MVYPGRLANVLLLVALSGCAGQSNSAFKNLSPSASRELAHQLAYTRDCELRDDLARAFAQRTPRNILILSNGDADGAFGCGVLCGWRKSATSPRPKFDIVTGVSTGALMATFAFLDTEPDDQTVKYLYTHLRDKDVFDGPFTAGAPNSVFDTKPLERLIERHVTKEAIRRVAQAHLQGRRLYATTVELETGQAVIWPLSKIAADACQTDTPDPGGVARFRKILLAAAAIPVIFPPVEIDGNLHVDAGLRESITLRRIMLGLSHSDQTGDTTPPTVWAIVNGRVDTPPQVVENNLLSIGARSLNLYTDSLQLFCLRDAAHVAAAHNPPFRFRWIAEPDDQPPRDSNLLGPMFDPKTTTSLFNQGESMMQGDPWHDGPPSLESDPK